MSSVPRSDREESLLSPGQNKEIQAAQADPENCMGTCGAAVQTEQQPSASVSREEGREIASCQLFFAAMLVCVSPLLFGFNISFTSPTQITMEGDILGGIPPPPSLVEFTPNTEQWYASLFNIGAMIGAFSGSSLSERFGRKKTMAFTAIPHMIAWAGTALAKSAPLLLVLRILSGWAVGIGSAVTPCYIAEVATPSLRGALGATNQLSITIGIFGVNVLGNYVFLTDEEGQEFCDWRKLSTFGFALSFLLVFMSCMPESPHWFAQRGQTDATHRSLKRLRARSSNITSECSAIVSESLRTSTDVVARECGALALEPEEPAEAEAAERTSQPSIFTTYRNSLIVGLGLCIFQQVTGANAVMMYTTKICKQAGMQDAQTAALLAMGAQVIFTGMACGLIEKLGRRPLLIFACICMILAHATFSYYYMAQGHGWFAPSWLALAALTIFILGFSTGMGPVPWLILAEIFPMEVRGTASSIAIGANWLASFVVTLGFEPLQNAITPQGTFLLFAVISLACLIFVLAFVPETKGKSVEQVVAEMKHRRAQRSSPDNPRETVEN